MPRLWVWLSNQELVLRLVSEAEPTNKLWEKKMYPGAKKVSIFSKNPLTHRILPVQSLTEHRTPNTEHRTPNTEHRTPNTEHIEETLSNTASISGAWRPAANSFRRECAAGLFRLNRFSPVIIPAVCSGKNKVL